VGLYLGYYRAQQGDAKLVSSSNSLLPRGDEDSWNLVRSGAHGLALEGGPVTLRSAHILGRIQPGTAQRAELNAWRVYWIDGRWVAGDARAKLATAWARVRGRGDDGAVLVLWVDDENRARATEQLERFARDNLGAIDTLLQQMRDTR
jgi:EpsI family protein